MSNYVNVNLKTIKEMNKNRKQSNLIRPKHPADIPITFDPCAAEYCSDCMSWKPVGHWRLYHRCHYCEHCDYYTAKDEVFDKHLKMKTHQKRVSEVVANETLKKSSEMRPHKNP